MNPLSHSNRRHVDCRIIVQKLEPRLAALSQSALIRGELAAISPHHTVEGSIMSETKRTMKDAGQKVVDSMKDVGHKVADAASKVGHKMAEGAKQATEYVKEKTGLGEKSCGTARSISDVQPHMEVISSCGCKMGLVDHLEGNTIKLTKNDSPDGRHHFIPLGWVARVDEHVHLNKNAEETLYGWKTDAASCGNCGA
jgi:hypothetical protein